MTSFFGAGGLERFSGHWRQGEGTLAAAVLAGRGSARGRGWRPLAETAAHSLRGLLPASGRPPTLLPMVDLDEDWEQLALGNPQAFDMNKITLLSFDLQRNCYIKDVVLFEDNSILLLPESLESSEW